MSKPPTVITVVILNIFYTENQANHETRFGDDGRNPQYQLK